MIIENEIEVYFIYERFVFDNVYIRLEILERLVLIIEIKMYDLYLYIFMDNNF